MDLEFVDAWIDDYTLANVESLMHEAFPEVEQVSVESLVSLAKATPASLKAVLCDGVFCGFLFWDWRGQIVYIGFLAVAGDKRSLGLGSRMLDHVKDAHPDSKIFLEVETLSDTAAPNIEQRCRRLDFYKRNGFRPTAIHSREHGVIYDVLVFGGDVAKDEVKSLFDEVMPALGGAECVEVFEDD